VISEKGKVKRQSESRVAVVFVCQDPPKPETPLAAASLPHTPPTLATKFSSMILSPFPNPTKRFASP